MEKKKAREPKVVTAINHIAPKPKSAWGGARPRSGSNPQEPKVRGALSAYQPVNGLSSMVLVVMYGCVAT